MGLPPSLPPRESQAFGRALRARGCSHGGGRGGSARQNPLDHLSLCYCAPKELGSPPSPLEQWEPPPPCGLQEAPSTTAHTR